MKNKGLVNLSLNWYRETIARKKNDRLRTLNFKKIINIYVHTHTFVIAPWKRTDIYIYMYPPF